MPISNSVVYKSRKPRFGSWARRWMDIAVTIALFVSAYTSGEGLSVYMDKWYVAYTITYAIALVIDVIFIYHNHRYPTSTDDEKRHAKFVLFFMCLVYFLGSTPLSVISISGKAVTVYQIQKAIKNGGEQANSYYENGRAEDNLVGPFQTYAGMFGALAESDKQGILSGKAGVGLVVGHLTALKSSFENYAENQIKSKAAREAALVRVQAIMAEGNVLLSQMMAAPRGSKEYEAKLNAIYGKINELNTANIELRNLSNMKFLEISMGRLNDLTDVITKGQGDTGQQAALESVKKPVVAAQETLQKLFEEVKKSHVTVENDKEQEIMNVGLAIYVYFWMIPFAWSFGILLDACPLFVLFSRTGYARQDQEDENRDEQDRDKAIADAELLALEAGNTRSGASVTTIEGRNNRGF